jgi:hypothetical protein
MNMLGKSFSTLNKGLEATFSNAYIMAIVKVSLAIYAAQYAPRLPTEASKWMENTYVKMALLFALIYISEKDFQLAIILAVAYVLSINYLARGNPLESFSDYSKEYTPASDQKLIEPRTMIYPGCDNLKMADLDGVFDGDRKKLTEKANYAFKDLFSKMADQKGRDVLIKMAYAAGLPYNKEFTDEHAPYIATILMYQGMNVSDSCQPPSDETMKF